LKDDDDDKKNGAQEGAEKPIESKQFQLSGPEIDDDKNSDADQHLYCPCSPDEKNGAVDDERYKQNINYILPS
jgi:hypothetical protein